METQRCYQCVKHKRMQLLETCECGLVYCIKHRFHDCPAKKKKFALPESVQFQKIQKI